jgi:hypothetical protein
MRRKYKNIQILGISASEKIDSKQNIIFEMQNQNISLE